MFDGMAELMIFYQNTNMLSEKAFNLEHCLMVAIKKLKKKKKNREITETVFGHA